MRRPPLIPTIFVALAAAAMIGLGFWQLRRAQWKEGLLHRYAVASRLPEIAYPPIPPAGDTLLFRRASGFCLQVVGWRAVAGRGVGGESGWSHIAACRTGGAEGPGMQVDAGWSRSDKPPAWRGGEVQGVIGQDRVHRIRLVSATGLGGLAASAPPSLDSIPNNHRAYAVQWFIFAALTAAIYLLALRRRPR